MPPSSQEFSAALCFFLAVLHTFSVKGFQYAAQSQPRGSLRSRLLHGLAEVELVFPLWALVLVVIQGCQTGISPTATWLSGLPFGEPFFVLVILVAAATRPVIRLAGELITFVARWLPLPRPVAFYFTALTLGPLLGSFITEPAAMTVTAFLLKDHCFDKPVSQRLRYLSLAVLFVGISIGGVLTPFAAPPIIVVARPWNWGVEHLFIHFGWKACVALVVNASLASAVLFRELAALDSSITARMESAPAVPVWLGSLHVALIAAIVLAEREPLVLALLGLALLGLTRLTSRHQDALRLREGTLVALFLAGLLVLGSLQQWWLKPLLARLDGTSLYLGTTFLTAFVDNAALTYLGAQVASLSEGFKHALVAGAVVGGGLTVIANAPNPAGFALLEDSFGEKGIHPGRFFAWALLPTLVALVLFWILPPRWC